jgi:hypothetical protein
MKNLLFLTIPLILLSCGQQSDKPLTDMEIGRMKEDVKPIVNRIIESMKPPKVEMFLEPFWNSKEFIYIYNGQVLDYSGLANMCKEVFPTLESQTFIQNSEKISVLSQNSLIYIWIGTSEAKLKTGETVKFDQFEVSWIFKKIDGLWKIIYYQESSQMQSLPVQPDTTIPKK